MSKSLIVARLVAALSLAVVGATMPARAQAPGGGQPGAAAQQDPLGLTPEQKTKLKAVQDKYMPKVIAIANKYKPQGEAIQKKYKPQLDAIQKKYKPQMDVVTKMKDGPEKTKKGNELMQKMQADAKPISTKVQAEMKPLMTKILGETSAIQAQAEKEIMAFLKPDQQSKFKKLLDQQKAMQKSMMQQGGM